MKYAQKPQDMVILLKVHCLGSEWTYDDVEDIVILLDGCEVLEAEFNRTRGEVKVFLGSWFQENRENLQEAVLSFLPTSSVDREDLVIDLIERFGQVI